MTTNRQSHRLNYFDYSTAGYYFVTICTHNMQPMFGEIVDGKMRLNEAGKVVESEWIKNEMIRSNVKLDEFVIMPNHMHGIIKITHSCRGVLQYAPTKPVVQYAPTKPAVQYASTNPESINRNPRQFQSPSQTIGSIFRGFKSSVTKRINLLYNRPGHPLWQRNYYDHIIRSEKSLHAIREYIHNNPLKWELDKYYRVHSPL